MDVDLEATFDDVCIPSSTEEDYFRTPESKPLDVSGKQSVVTHAPEVIVEVRLESSGIF